MTSLSHIVTRAICNECETVAHCGKYGCIPKVPLPRVQFSAWRYLCGYVPLFVQFRDHAAAKRAGHLAAITKREPDGIIFAGREPTDWQAVCVWIAVGLCFAAVAAASAWPIH